MTYLVQCTYCGYESWFHIEYGHPENCLICGDVNLKAYDPAKKIDYYQGCPPFPPTPSSLFPLTNTVTKATQHEEDNTNDARDLYDDAYWF